MLFLGWVVAINPDGANRVHNTALELGLTLEPPPGTAGISAPFAWASQAMAAIAPLILAARIQFLWVTLLMGSFIALVILLYQRAIPPQSAAPSPALPFVLLLILTASLLTLGPEFVYIRDNFGQRLNTIFKFYYQAWAMFGVAALVGLHLLWERAKSAGILAAAGYLAMLAIALLFPYFGVQSRAAEYGGNPTLDGIAHLASSNPDEYEAILWLRQNVPGEAVLLEAVGGQYSAYGRISAHTGLPTILGWAGHEFQWRGFSNPEPGRREPLVKQIYTDPNWDTTVALLNQLDVDYIYVGPLERGDFNQAQFDKFEQNLEIAFQNGAVTIYRWQPQ